MTKKLLLTGIILLASAFSAAQVNTSPGTPAQVRQALSEAPGNWASQGIQLVVEKGIFIGYPDGTFEWSEQITRAEAALAIARLIQAFDLELFDPAELQVLRNAVHELSNNLAGLRNLVAEHDGQLAAVALSLGQQDGEIGDLWNALNALDQAPEVFDATELWHELTAHNERIDALEQAVAELKMLAAADAGATELQAAELRSALALLEAELVATRQQAAALDGRIDNLEARVTALETETSSQRQLTSLLATRVDSLAEDLAASEVRLQALLGGLEDQLADHEARIARLEENQPPDRNPLYLALALYGSAPDAGLIGHVALGHDALYGNIGARVAAEFGFADVPFSIAGAVTYRTSMEQADGYAGIGVGASFEDGGSVMFGELLIGVSFQIIKNFGIYAEGRYRPYFDGSGDGFAALGGGIQIRF